MAGPQVRGDIKVSRNVQTRKVRQGVKTFVPITATPELSLEAGDTYSVIINRTALPANAVAARVKLPPVSVASFTTVTSSVDGSVTSVPTGPTSGVGTEFRVSNFSTVDATVLDSASKSLLTIPDGHTAVFYCTAVAATTGTPPVADTVGTWHSYVVDAATTFLTPRNVPFDKKEGLAAVSSAVTLSGTTTSAVGTVSLSFTAGSVSYSVTSGSIASGTDITDVADTLVSFLQGDKNFSEFYTVSVATVTTVSTLTITAIDNGTKYNSSSVTLSAPTGTTVSTTGAIAGGTDGSWTREGAVSVFKIARVRHQRGLDPITNVFEQQTVGGVKTEVLVEETTNPTTGEIILTVNASPTTMVGGVVTPVGLFAGSVDIL